MVIARRSLTVVPVASPVTLAFLIPSKGNGAEVKKILGYVASLCVCVCVCEYQCEYQCVCVCECVCV